MFDRILKSDTSILNERDIKSGTYVLETLEAVLWCFLRGKNFQESLLSAVNLGEDTDTVAAVTGGLAGILYGEKGIPEEWMTRICKKKEIFTYTNAFINSITQ